MTIAVVALATLVVVLLLAHEREREQWRRERAELLNRIKPETAQPLDVPTERVEPAERAHDVDADYWKARGIEVAQ